jgi:RNA polymerase sigma factor (sigma-70 family)
MAPPALGVALQQIRRMTVPHDYEERPDHQLLCDFVRRQDEAAFEALIRRHGSLVLRVCRQVLHHAQDAEDSFQATFLILARQAATIRKTEALAGWLHKVAFHVASKARRGAARRRAQESRVQPMTQQVSSHDHSWHEVQGILHEEIERLSEALRAPFILCVLESKSRPEVARQLGCKEGTVSSRLARARERLRRQLTRRGVTLSAVLAAGALSEGEESAAVSALLVGSTVRAALQVAAGIPIATAAGSAQVSALVTGGIRAMRATQSKTTAALLLAVGLLTAGMGMLTYHTLAAKQPAATQSDGPRPTGDKAKGNTPSKHTILAGLVVDEAGKGVAGAEVEVKDAREPARAVSKSDGTFQLSVSDPTRFGFRLLARSPDGDRLGYLRVDGSEQKNWQSLHLVLKAARRVEMTVADAEGRPLAGARAGSLSDGTIMARAVSDAKGRAALRVPADCPVEHVYAWQNGLGFDYRSFQKSRDTSDHHAKAPAVPTKAISLKLDGARTLRVTARDADAKPIANMRMYPWYLIKPGETTDINLSGAGTEFDSMTNNQGVATWDWLPNWQTQPVTIWPDNKDYGQRRLSWDPKAGGAAATLVLDRLEWLRGKVVHFNGAPAAGITVRIDGDGFTFDGFHGDTKTGADGRYAVRVPPNLIYLLVVSDQKWTAEPQTGFAVLPKTPTLDKDFVLRPATSVRGRVTVGEARKPLAGQHLVLQQLGADLPSQPDVNLPNPEGSRKYVCPRIGHVLQTDADGRFDFRVGPGRYQLMGPDQVEPVEITITDQAKVEVDLHAPRAETGTLKGVVVTGKPPAPVPNAVVAGVYKASVGARDFAVTTNAEGRFDGERRRHRMVLHAKSADGKLAGVVEVEPDDTKVTIPLAKVAMAKGRLLDSESGKPMAGREIVYGVQVPVGDQPNAPFRTTFGGKVKTNRTGHFALKGLVAGQTYVVNVTLKENERWGRLLELVPEAGQAVDLGDVRLAPERRPPQDGPR